MRPGEIITFASDIAGPALVTHRVQQVRFTNGTAHVVTKGDANTEPEVWTAPAGTLVGRVQWSIPKVGRLLILLGESTTRWLLLARALAVVSVAVAVGSLRRLRLRPVRVGLGDDERRRLSRNATRPRVGGVAVAGVGSSGPPGGEGAAFSGDQLAMRTDCRATAAARSTRRSAAARRMRISSASDSDSEAVASCACR